MNGENGHSNIIIWIFIIDIWETARRREWRQKEEVKRQEILSKITIYLDEKLIEGSLRNSMGQGRDPIQN